MSDGAARERLVLALDVDELDAARSLARSVASSFATVKVGYELYARSGPEAFAAMREDGFAVFADLKLHDIPTTVARAARILGASGISFLTVHAAGGAAMVAAAVEGLAEGAARAGVATPTVLGVTVLTSDPDASAFDDRVRSVLDGGADAVVCSGHEVARARAFGLRTLVPGVRPAGAGADDQARVVTPGQAIAAGADWLVIGRAVTAAADPLLAARAVAREVEEACTPG
jgi:orotidine-5'-phosphate decarboxylase